MASSDQVKRPGPRTSLPFFQTTPLAQARKGNSLISTVAAYGFPTHTTVEIRGTCDLRREVNRAIHALPNRLAG